MWGDRFPLYPQGCMEKTPYGDWSTTVYHSRWHALRTRLWPSWSILLPWMAAPAWFGQCTFHWASDFYWLLWSWNPPLFRAMHLLLAHLDWKLVFPRTWQPGARRGKKKIRLHCKEFNRRDMTRRHIQQDATAVQYRNWFQWDTKRQVHRERIRGKRGCQTINPRVIMLALLN